MFCLMYRILTVVIYCFIRRCFASNNKIPFPTGSQRYHRKFYIILTLNYFWKIVCKFLLCCLLTFKLRTLSKCQIAHMAMLTVEIKVTNSVWYALLPLCCSLFNSSLPAFKYFAFFRDTQNFLQWRIHLVPNLLAHWPGWLVLTISEYIWNFEVPFKKVKEKLTQPA